MIFIVGKQRLCMIDHADFYYLECWTRSNVELVMPRSWEEKSAHVKGIIFYLVKHMKAFESKSGAKRTRGYSG